jgi:hypothetical protein
VPISYRTGILFVGLTLACGSAHAQIASCGGVTVTHSMRQTPNYKKSVDVSATTALPITFCPIQLQTEVWVNALSTYVTTKRALYTAAVFQSRNVPSYGLWHSTAKHWLLTTPWTDLGRTFADAVVYAPPVGLNQCEIQASDCLDGYEFKPASCDCVTLSPILIDTTGDGYRLSRAEDGVEFDLNDNGAANERVAWTEPDSDDGWLVLDRNGNGAIDSGAELFGSKTPAYADAVEPRSANGFEALLLAEGPTYGGGVADGVIDARDAIYSRLRIWFDRNHNGKSEPAELVALETLGIVSIGTDYKKIGRQDAHGNEFSLVGGAIVRDADGVEKKRRVFDVFLTVWPSKTASSVAASPSRQ